MAAQTSSKGLTAFIEGLYGKLPETLSTLLIAPSAVFWLGLVSLLTGINPDNGRTSSIQKMYDWTADQPQITQLVLLFAIVAAISLSALVVESLLPMTQQILSGQWYVFNRIGEALVNHQDRDVTRHRARWKELATKIHREGFDTLTAEERSEFARIEGHIIRVPLAKNRRKPTQVGNIVESSAVSTEGKYGLDFEICWSRLWLLLNESARTEATAARDSVTSWVRVWTWGLLFAATSMGILFSEVNSWDGFSQWMVLWPLAGLLVAVYAYSRLIGASLVWADTVESCFDLYRKELYTSLRWPLPINTEEEVEVGERLSMYLLRGEPHFPLPLTDAEGKIASMDDADGEAEISPESFLTRLWRWVRSLT